MPGRLRGAASKRNSQAFDAQSRCTQAVTEAAAQKPSEATVREIANTIARTTSKQEVTRYSEKDDMKWQVGAARVQCVRTGQGAALGRAKQDCHGTIPATLTPFVSFQTTMPVDRFGWSSTHGPRST